MGVTKVISSHPFAAPIRWPAGRWAELAERARLPTLIVLLIGVLIWSVLSQRFGEYLFPSPARVFAGLVRVIASGELWVHVSATLYRITLGFSAAVLVALLAGFLLARLGWAKMVVKDVTAILNSTS